MRHTKNGSLHVLNIRTHIMNGYMGGRIAGMVKIGTRYCDWIVILSSSAYIRGVDLHVLNIGLRMAVIPLQDGSSFIVCVVVITSR
jgi:hypothetical protein